jgi:sulfite exporter TauE/SafE
MPNGDSSGVPLAEGSAVLEAALPTALATGFLGSIHCAAMCGPLAMAGGTRDGRVDPRALGGYVGGRFVSYAATGALMGTIGRHALCLLPVAKVQWIAMIVVAGAFLVRGVSLLRAARPALISLRARKRRRIIPWIVARLPRRGLGLGLATPLLPCGMLIPAWLLAATSGGAAQGAIVMAAFAAASFPALLAPLAAQRPLGSLARRLPRAHAVAWMLLAILVAVRPLLAAAHHHH